ncbi:hypothetical protein FGADI_3885 [Fusarium gaditjirri]|uniref:Uncharacterized protein n=1 Tax=Fusarium gaditjirri TaxID=282569 RepID=A0A8H4TE48_9HYPO|nr:hypothetical protein FGADI_3885 [Fusarium gaditjirri]
MADPTVRADHSQGESRVFGQGNVELNAGSGDIEGKQGDGWVLLPELVENAQRLEPLGTSMKSGENPLVVEKARGATDGSVDDMTVAGMKRKKSAISDNQGELDVNASEFGPSKRMKESRYDPTPFTTDADAPTDVAPAEAMMEEISASLEEMQWDQTPLAVLYQDKVYFQSREAASLEGRKRLYNLYCASYGSPENPLEMELPEVFDFQHFVWGKQGENWAVIQDRYVPRYIKFTWGYPGGIPDGAVPLTHEVPPEAIANVGHVLTIGLEDENDQDMYHHSMVFEIWAMILQWYKTCVTDKPKRLILAFHQMDLSMFRVAAIPYCTEPRPDSAARQKQSVLDEKSCSTEIKKIISKGSREMENELDEWLLGESVRTCFSPSERIQMVSCQWHILIPSKEEYNRSERWYKSSMDKYGHLSC